MEEKEIIKTKVICHKCGEIIEVDNLFNKPTHKELHTEDGRYYTIVYVKCPRCKEITAVQADTVETRRILSAFKRLCGKVVAKQMKGETVSPKDLKRRDKLLKEMREKREVAKNECTGLKFLDENEEIFVEHLTFF